LINEKICQESSHLMWDFPHVICSCVRRQDSFHLHLLQNASSARPAKTEKATIINSPITTNMRLTIDRTSLLEVVVSHLDST